MPPSKAGGWVERVAIVGAREHPDLSIVEAYVRSLGAVTVISGGAEGVDQAAQRARVQLGRQPALKFEPMAFAHTIRVVHRNGSPRPRYERLAWYETGEEQRTSQTWLDWSIRDALIYRNTLIALDCTRMVVFPDGSKGGCWDAADQARRFRRPCEIRWADGRVEPYRGRRA